MKTWAKIILVPLGIACVALLCLSVVGLPLVALGVMMESVAMHEAPLPREGV